MGSAERPPAPEDAPNLGYFDFNMEWFCPPVLQEHESEIIDISVAVPQRRPTKVVVSGEEGASHKAGVWEHFINEANIHP